MSSLWIIFFSPPHHTLSLEARPQLSKSIWIFHWGLRARLVCARQEQSPLHLLLICAQAWPGPAFLHVLLSFHNDLFLFIQSWNPQEPLQSQAHTFLISLGPSSDGTFSTLLPLVCSFPVGFSFTFTCQILPWCNFPFLLSFSVTVGEVVRNVMLYSHPFCQPGSPVTAAVVVNWSPWPWAAHEEFWINLLLLSLLLVLIFRNQSSSPPLTVLTVTHRAVWVHEVFWPWDSWRLKRGHQQRG